MISTCRLHFACYSRLCHIFPHREYPKSMIRRIVCLLLVPTLLANQVAMCCAHTHYDSDDNDHSSRTHFHFFGHTHKADTSDHHDHHHHHGDHHHGDCDEHGHCDEPAPAESESNLEFDSNYPVDHDHDAVFFGEQDAVQIQSNRLTFEGLTFTSICLVAELLRDETQSYRTQVARAGPFSPYYCAIYLQIGCLRI